MISVDSIYHCYECGKQFKVSSDFNQTDWIKDVNNVYQYPLCFQCWDDKPK